MPSYRKYHAMSHYAAPHRTAYHRIPPHNTAYHRYAATHTAAHHFTSPPTTSHHLLPPPTASPTSQYSSTLPSMADGVEIMSINIISAAPVDNQVRCCHCERKQRWQQRWERALRRRKQRRESAGGKEQQGRQQRQDCAAVAAADADRAPCLMYHTRTATNLPLPCNLTIDP